MPSYGLIGLRLFGFMAGAIAIYLVFNRFRHGKFKRTDFLFANLISILVIITSVYPDAVNILLKILSLKRDQYSRIIALLIFSNFAIWFLLFYLRLKVNWDVEKLTELVRAIGLDEFVKAYGGKDFVKPVMVVIPAYNERDNIGQVLRKMPKTVSGFPLGVIVVVDGGDDGTEDVVREMGFPVIRSKINRGGGAALKLGYDICYKYDTKVIVTMDADGQHLPEDIPGLVKPILEDNYDIVIGSRILGHREKDSLFRLAGVHIFSRLINVLSGAGISDCSSGFRAFRASSLKKIRLRQDQFHTSELIIDAAKRGIRIGEAPISVMRRISGISKKGKNLKYGMNFFKNIVTDSLL